MKDKERNRSKIKWSSAQDNFEERHIFVGLGNQ